MEGEPLKVGDTVIVSQPFGYPDVKGKVVRITPTQVVVLCRRALAPAAYEYKFRKDTGYQIPYSRDGLRLRVTQK